jgi:hypothetical protein
MLFSLGLYSQMLVNLFLCEILHPQLKITHLRKLFVQVNSDHRVIFIGLFRRTSRGNKEIA